MSIPKRPGPSIPPRRRQGHAGRWRGCGGVEEAYVLRSLRHLGLSTEKIRDAAAEIRRQFDTEYGLASRRIATDGVMWRAGEPTHVVADEYGLSVEQVEALVRVAA